MFREKEMLFSRVNEWQDVYENYLLKQNLVVKNVGSVSTQDVMDRCYGQSWTLLEESDAMWRIYSDDMNSVKVTTTAEKLMDVLYDNDSWLTHLLPMSNIKLV